jgi:plastocyanin
VHALALQLAPVVAAEKSKTVFYIVGGVLVVWAFGLALGIGTLRPDFPTNSRGERIVIAISIVLVLGTLVAAVATSGSPEKTEAAKAAEAATAAKAAKELAAPEPSSANGASASVSAPAAAPVPAATTPATTTPATTTPATTTTAPTRTPAKAPATSTAHEPTPNATKLALSVPGTQLAYNTKLLTAKAGSVTIAMTNMSPLEHNVTIAEGSKVLGATPTFTGGVKSVTLNLKPGKYTFYCSVPGHRQAGMEGTLVIK